MTVNKSRKEQGQALGREELLWKPPCHWSFICSACLQDAVRLAAAVHWVQQLQLWRPTPPLSFFLVSSFLLLPFTLITVWESSVSTTHLPAGATSRTQLFTEYCSMIHVKLVNYFLLRGAQGSWSDVSVLPAISLHPPSLPLSVSLSFSPSLVSLNQDIACPFLFIAASLPPVCSVPLFVCPRFILFGSFPSTLLPRGPRHPLFKQAPHEVVASHYKHFFFFANALI